MKCSWCEEEILSGERAPIFGSDLHHECGVRMFVGSVGHIAGRCGCFGATEEDPPNMTKRQAAQAAVAAIRIKSKMVDLLERVWRGEHVREI